MPSDGGKKLRDFGGGSGKIGFIWAMAAIEPVVDRDYMKGIHILEDYKDVKFID